ncbi:MAG: heme-binding domain-containing protein [Acidimicrobiales bacterium]
MTINDDPVPRELAYGESPQKGPRRWLRRQDPGDGMSRTRMAGFTGLGCLALFGLLQVVPYGRTHSNPVVTGEPQWASAETRDLAVRACYDCHSNETKYPWYSNVAPMSWLTQNHIDEGRSKLNFSEFTTNPREAHEAVDAIESGAMPPNYYTWFGLHSTSKLTEDEKLKLIAGLQATPGFTERDRGGSGGATAPGADDGDGDRD